MRTSSEFLLTFLLNACWQIALIAAVTSIGSWFLRHSSARYRHRLWVSAFLLAFLIPLLASARIWFDGFVAPQISNAVVVDSQVTFESIAITSSSPSQSATLLNAQVAMAIVAVYVGFLLFSTFRLCAAWSQTRGIKQTAEPITLSDQLQKILDKCRTVIGRKDIEILCSASLPVPVTMGILKPVIILPEQLLNQGDENLLTSAIGHEAIHVDRRDYLWNLLYELIYLPLSFHPGAAFIRRRIKQTRELSCDELVAQRVLEPEIYARSLVTLASTAPPPRRLSINATVGIADADILEVRIMSLMNKSKLDERSRKILLLVVALLLVVPAATAVAFAMRFDVDPLATAITSQEQGREKEKSKEKEKQKLEESSEFRDGTRAAEREALQKRLETLGPERVAEREALKKRLEQLGIGTGQGGGIGPGESGGIGPGRGGGSERAVDEEGLQRKMETLNSEYEARKWRVEEELKARNIMHAALIRMARIPMDQAIQIALSQQPGKVIQSSLGAKGWEEPGKLAADGVVFYHVIVLSGDENSPALTHIWVNAIDNSIIKVEKELPRKMRQEQP